MGAHGRAGCLHKKLRAYDPAMTGKTTPDREEAPGTSLAFVAAQVVGYSLLAWTLTALLTLALVTLGHRTFVDGLRLSAWLMVIFVLVGGAVGAAGGPIPLSPGAATGLLRPLGNLSRTPDILIRPFRTRTEEVGQERRNGLTALGLALVIVPQLVLVATLLESGH